MGQAHLRLGLLSPSRNPGAQNDSAHPSPSRGHEQRSSWLGRGIRLLA